MESVPPRMKNWMVLAFSLGFSLLFCEIYLRWNPPEWLPSQIMVSVQQTHSEPTSNPILGYLPKANLVKPFKGREFNTLVKINSHHMRDKEYPYSKPPGVKRIVAVGDSYVFGWGVEAKETVTELLEEKYLRNVEVLNMGVSGYEAGQELELLRTEGIRFAPDLVLFFSYGLPAVSSDEYQFDGDRLYWGSVRRDLLSERIHSFVYRHVYLWAFLEMSLGRLRQQVSILLKGPEKFEKTVSPSFNEKERIDRELGILFPRLKKLAQERKFVPIVVFFADKWDLDPNLLSPFEKKTIQILAERCHQEGWGFLDLTLPLQESKIFQGKDPYFKYDAHWNVHGHRAAAHAIAKYLREAGFLDPPYFKSSEIS